jgi:hypothetical protein
MSPRDLVLDIGYEKTVKEEKAQESFVRHRTWTAFIKEKEVILLPQPPKLNRYSHFQLTPKSLDKSPLFIAQNLTEVSTSSCRCIIS